MSSFAMFRSYVLVLCLLLSAYCLAEEAQQCIAESFLCVSKTESLQWVGAAPNAECVGSVEWLNKYLETTDAVVPSNGQPQTFICSERSNLPDILATTDKSICKSAVDRIGLRENGKQISHFLCTENEVLVNASISDCQTAMLLLNKIVYDFCNNRGRDLIQNTEREDMQQNLGGRPCTLNCNQGDCKFSVKDAPGGDVVKIMECYCKEEYKGAFCNESVKEKSEGGPSDQSEHVYIPGNGKHALFLQGAAFWVAIGFGALLCLCISFCVAIKLLQQGISKQINAKDPDGRKTPVESRIQTPCSPSTTSTTRGIFKLSWSATPFFKSFVGSADSKDEHPSKKSPEFKSLSEEQLAIANLEDALNNNFFEDNKARMVSAVSVSPSANRRVSMISMDGWSTSSEFDTPKQNLSFAAMQPSSALRNSVPKQNPLYTGEAEQQNSSVIRNLHETTMYESPVFTMGSDIEDMIISTGRMSLPSRASGLGRGGSMVNINFDDISSSEYSSSATPDFGEEPRHTDDIGLQTSSC